MVQSIEYIPCGGMCNRLMTMASAAQIATEKNINVTIRWNNNNDLSADFSQLFEPVGLKNVKVVENYNLLYKCPTRYNHYLPRILQILLFNKRRFYHPQWGDYSILDTMKPKKLLIESFYSIGDIKNLNELFVPQKEIRDKIDKVTKDFNNVIGLHIRRTDHIHAVNRSTDELFIEIMNKEIEQDNSVKFYVATDDVKVVEKLREVFGDRIIHPELVLSRTSVEGMKDAVLDLFCLSRTKKIYGSCKSSYSFVAAKLGNLELITCEK